MSSSLDRLRLILALLRREYAVQFAGMGAGLLWLAVQYTAQIAVFLLVFGRGIYAGAPTGAYASRLLAGMLLWLPLSEMLTRSTGILIENRALIRRTNLGRDLFPWLPSLQALIHYTILSVPTGVVLALTTGLSVTAAAGFVFGLCITAFMSVWSIFLARTTILLRDLGPIIRPALQALFWLTPIAYYATPWSVMNPLTWVFETHSLLWLGHTPSSGPGMTGHASIAPDPWVALSAPLAMVFLTLLVLAGSSRLKRIVEDEL